MVISLATSKLPRSPLLIQVSALLRKHKLGKIRVQFLPEVKRLGESFYVTILKVTEAGVVDSWKSYLSDDWMQQTVEARDVTVSEDECFVEIIGFFRREIVVTLYLNPSLSSLFAGFLPSCSADPKRFPRLASILKVFEYPPVARPQNLDGLDVSSEELVELVQLGYLTCGKGKKPEVTDAPSVHRGYELSRTYRLNCARITREGETFLSWCSGGEGKIEKVKALIKEGVDVNTKDEHNQTPLLLAADQGHIEVVKLLLENRADVDAKGLYSTTALMLAAVKGHLEIVKALLENGADVNARADNGSTALLLAAFGRETNAVEIINLLLDRGADINAKAMDGYTALMMVIPPEPLGLGDGIDPEMDKWSEKVRAHNKVVIEIAKTLLARGVDINAKDHEGWTALMIAKQCRKGAIPEDASRMQRLVRLLKEADA